jgi:hypothetical protein
MARDPYQNPNAVFILIGIVIVIALIAIILIVTGVAA